MDEGQQLLALAFKIAAKQYPALSWWPVTELVSYAMERAGYVDLYEYVKDYIWYVY